MCRCSNVRACAVWTACRRVIVIVFRAGQSSIAAVLPPCLALKLKTGFLVGDRHDRSRSFVREERDEMDDAKRA